MKKIAVVGTGYVGLVTGVCLAEIGHDVTCIDVDQEKIDLLKSGKSPIYEPGIEELISKNVASGNLRFSLETQDAYEVGVIYIAVGTPQKKDGSADLQFVEEVAKRIAHNIKNDVVVVTKSTVPLGTNHSILKIIKEHLQVEVSVDIASNPEFLREGSAIYDSFNGDRIVIGVENDRTALILEEINKPFNIPIFKTDIRSAELIKYAANAFLATKISFINEIASICEKVGANVEDVSMGMGKDHRIGSQFLNAGIGYGGSCFPKDTSALLHIAKEAGYQFEILSSVIKINENQKSVLIKKAKERLGTFHGKRIALLGLSFKPNTDDMREAASIDISNQLIEEGANVKAFDPVATNAAKNLLHPTIQYVGSINEAIQDADAVFILTEWKEIVHFPITNYVKFMKHPIIFDGRNCYHLEEISQHSLDYYSIGRPTSKAIDR
ncbi:UDP-glucose dehydrogenase family protein [Metabacillus litoralis]|uniref:UDP-glucose dehydrogenase family protein n=1 Tax=Metabacillus litoralis TaxID=152268 RepID=UPI001CFF0719|nr:UDP-glucose/GDP-mannose dehydrogenase family protein [Metabacillus litoralis]